MLKLIIGSRVAQKAREQVAMKAAEEGIQVVYTTTEFPKSFLLQVASMFCLISEVPDGKTYLFAFPTAKACLSVLGISEDQFRNEMKAAEESDPDHPGAGSSN